MSPAAAVQVNLGPSERHTLTLQAAALLQAALTRQRDASASCDHPVPRNPEAHRAAPQRRADMAGVARKAECDRHIPVSGHPTSRDAGHERPNQPRDVPLQPPGGRRRQAAARESHSNRDRLSADAAQGDSYRRPNGPILPSTSSNRSLRVPGLLRAPLARRYLCDV